MDLAITTSNVLVLLPFLVLTMLLRLGIYPYLAVLIRHPRMAPTKFHLPSGVAEHAVFPPPAAPRRILDHSKNIDNGRYEFLKRLGLGREGCASIYVDHERGGQKVVIKEFFRGVRTNPLPAHLRPLFGAYKDWPAEIPASLYFSPGHGENGMGRFMRVVDYFWVDSPAWRGSGWRLVTPFLKSGTLETLAGLVHMCGLSPEDVDGIYRRRFRGVLMALKEMHTRGYTHDDVKTDNIFVAENGEFLLGDLGNVREHEHGYHSHAPDMHTGHKDYRQGDTERAVRSYLTFLRFACGDQRVFDRDFREMRAEWSEFFWRYKRNCSTAEDLLRNDVFWGEGAGWAESSCREFEKRVETLREEMERRKRQGLRLQQEEKEKNGWTVPEAVEEQTREVDSALACVSPTLMEKILPWKRQLSHSSY